MLDQSIFSERKYERGLTHWAILRPDDYLVQQKAYALIGDAQYWNWQSRSGGSPIYKKAADTNENKYFTPNFKLIYRNKLAVAYERIRKDSKTQIATYIQLKKTITSHLNLLAKRKT